MSVISKVIKIVATPDGDPPEWVRKEWVGCIMPCEPECGHIPMYATGLLEKPRKGLLSAKDVLSGAVKPLQKIAGFSVDTKVALDILVKKSRPAAKWFYDHGYPKAGQAFRFKTHECQIIEFVPESELRKLHIHDDLERGTMMPR
jgi:hypothetical protein